MGAQYTLREVCVLPRCPHRTVGRLIQKSNQKTFDFCSKHRNNMLRLYPELWIDVPVVNRDGRLVVATEEE